MVQVLPSLARRGTWHEPEKLDVGKFPLSVNVAFLTIKDCSATVMSMWSLFNFGTLQVLSSQFTMEIDEPKDLLSGSGSSGYDLALFENDHFLEKYKCTICRKILRNTVQVSNNQAARRACRKCYVDKIRYIIFVIVSNIDNIHNLFELLEASSRLGL